MDLPIDIDTVKGFLAEEEGAVLHAHALAACRLGPGLEVGSYCGRSSVYIGMAAKACGSVLFAVDHHRGSEENQPGWPYFDETLWDARAEALDTLPHFRDTLRRSGLEDTVIAVIARSPLVARHWHTPLGFVFIDGGHTREHAMNDYRGWTPHLVKGGRLAIHDVFPDPADGGRPPFEIYQYAMASGLFREHAFVGSLRVLERL